MKVELLVSEWCGSCREAERVWRQVATERDIDFAVVDMVQPEGRELVSRLRLKTVPALVIDGELRGAGVQPLGLARDWVSAAPLRKQKAIQPPAMQLGLDNRLFIMSASVYLMVGGLGLVLNGSLLSDGPARPVAMHFVTIGFLLMLLFGLAAHMLPRFTGNPVRSGWPVWLQFGCVQGGLWGYAAGFWLGLPWLILLGGMAVWLSMGIFAWRIWPVLWPKNVSHQTPPQY